MARRAARSSGAEPESESGGWEERSLTRVLSAARERTLVRSRKFVQAAREILVAEGLESLTVRTVLDRTRLSRRSFYQRFDGIDDLLLAVFEQTFGEGVDLIRADIARVEGPLARFGRVIETMLLRARSQELIRYSVVLSRAHLRLADARPDDLVRALEPFTSLLAEQLEAAMALGLVRAGDARQLAGFVESLVVARTHASLLSHASVTQAEAEESAAALRDFCLRAVGAETPGSRAASD